MLLEILETNCNHDTIVANCICIYVYLEAKKCINYVSTIEGNFINMKMASGHASCGSNMLKYLSRERRCIGSICIGGSICIYLSRHKLVNVLEVS